jgi:hypothetical protein
LLAYLGGIGRNIHGKLMDSNARPDHVHCFLSLPPALAVAEALRLINSNSSLWVHETGHGAAFAWQVGYGAFSVSQSNVPAVMKYIRDQEQHHRTISLQEEFLAFSKASHALDLPAGAIPKDGPSAGRIPYDERYIWE